MSPNGLPLYLLIEREAWLFSLESPWRGLLLPLQEVGFFCECLDPCQAISIDYPSRFGYDQGVMSGLLTGTAFTRTFPEIDTTSTGHGSSSLQGTV